MRRGHRLIPGVRCGGGLVVALAHAIALQAQILEPNALSSTLSYRVDRLRDTTTAAARQQHQTLLENYSAEQVANLVAYLRTLN